jgi:hypothetical protein
MRAFVRGAAVVAAGVVLVAGCASPEESPAPSVGSSTIPEAEDTTAADVAVARERAIDDRLTQEWDGLTGEQQTFVCDEYAAGTDLPLPDEFLEARCA